MDLREYLFRNHMTQTALAKRLFITRKYLADIEYARIRPSVRLARDIERETGGAIKAEDLLKQNKASMAMEVCNGSV